MSFNYFPAFGGIASSKSLSNAYDIVEFDNLLSQERLRIYVTKGSDGARLKNHIINNDRFLWTGGFGRDIDLKTFDQFKNDEKFILVEFNSNTLNIYTDHYSRIPLFFSIENDTLYFSNSLRMLKKLKSSQSFNVDYRGLLFYYNFGFTNYTDYLEENIESVSGGKQISFDLEKNVLNQKSYYDIYRKEFDPSLRNATLKDNVQSIDNAIFNSTKKTLNHFDKIGVAMSGGVDSGYLAQKINECGRNFNSYSIGYKDGYDEFDRVDYLSKVLNFETKKIVIDEKDIIDNYIKVSEYSSYPIYFNNSILNFVYEEANRDNVDVIFDGDGADRMFLGSNSFIRLNKVLSVYKLSKKTNLQHLIPYFLKFFKNSTIQNLRFYFERFNHGTPFYGLRQLSNFNSYDKDFETLLNDIALPKEIPDSVKLDDWKYFIMFSIYYFSPCFLHNQYELQMKHNIASNPQFWTDDLVDLALNMPLEQKIHKKTTKFALREAAKTKIDDGYWNLSKIGLQNCYTYIKSKKVGKDFIHSYINTIKKTEEYLYLVENTPNTNIDPERLLPYYIWKEKLVK